MPCNCLSSSLRTQICLSAQRPKVRLDFAGKLVRRFFNMKRIKVMPEEADLKALKWPEEARDLIVNQRPFQALKSNPTADTSLTKKQMKKLKSRARASGLLGTGIGIIKRRFKDNLVLGFCFTMPHFVSIHFRGKSNVWVNLVQIATIT